MEKLHVKHCCKFELSESKGLQDIHTCEQDCTWFSKSVTDCSFLTVLLFSCPKTCMFNGKAKIPQAGKKSMIGYTEFSNAVILNCGAKQNGLG